MFLVLTIDSQIIYDCISLSFDDPVAIIGCEKRRIIFNGSNTSDTLSLIISFGFSSTF